MIFFLSFLYLIWFFFNYLDIVLQLSFLSLTKENCTRVKTSNWEQVYKIMLSMEGGEGVKKYFVFLSYSYTLQEILN